MTVNLCYPVTKHLITTDQSCNHLWTTQEMIGTDGTYGEIWSVCCVGDDDNEIGFNKTNKTNKTNKNCSHVMKYMPYDDGIRQNTQNDIINEISLQQACSSVGLCPQIQEAWLCETGGAFVMSVYKMTTRQLLLQFPDIKDKQQILANIITLTDKLHRYGIYHGDLHLDNIMVKTINNNIYENNPENNPEYKYNDDNYEYKYNDDNYEYYFIDFGKGGRFDSMNNTHIKNDYLDISSHIQDMIYEYPDNNFDELYKTMKIFMKKFD